MLELTNGVIDSFLYFTWLNLLTDQNNIMSVVFTTLKLYITTKFYVYYFTYGRRMINDISKYLLAMVVDSYP